MVLLYLLSHHSGNWLLPASFFSVFYSFGVHFFNFIIRHVSTEQHTWNGYRWNWLDQQKLRSMSSWVFTLFIFIYFRNFCSFLLFLHCVCQQYNLNYLVFSVLSQCNIFDSEREYRMLDFRMRLKYTRDNFDLITSTFTSIRKPFTT